MSLLLPQEKEDKKRVTSACAACASAASPQEGARSPRCSGSCCYWSRDDRSQVIRDVIKLPTCKLETLGVTHQVTMTIKVQRATNKSKFTRPVGVTMASITITAVAMAVSSSHVTIGCDSVWCVSMSSNWISLERLMCWDTHQYITHTTSASQLAVCQPD